MWRDALLVLDNTTTVDPANSSCGHSEQTLALRCGTSLLSMTFTKNETNFLSGIVAEYVLDTVHFPDAQHQGELVKVGNESLHLFGVEQGRSYLCGADSPVPLGGNTTLDGVLTGTCFLLLQRCTVCRTTTSATLCP
ncbi:hypothetical protein IscW_ISCW000501 [Ixodes scapularis]|uniref:Lysosome-associated membrane glycoprotein 2-like luminal domain-containing protein n=1 Tax=Ixodes scapularis TaxID=6945 RepID=B7P255_IXOSC|nr:hypothetical protein IscW_ISCW000501 [Ixodes scapularis]|eukprot:XP_002401516.1 hypothetical protein IscW_ISCW000501 [Ixodes scapularis]